MLRWLVGFAIWLCALNVGWSQAISSLAGTGEKGYSGDGGPAAKAQLHDPFDVAFDVAGNVFFSDTMNHCVRRIDAKIGVISTVAGCGRPGYSGDGGPATQATLKEPYGVELDAEGNLYVQDWNKTGRVTKLMKVAPDMIRGSSVTAD